jgi:signal transduction histidine kinase
LITPIRAEAIRTLYVQMRTSTWSAVVVSVYAAVTALPYTHWPVIAGWVAAQAGMQGLRIGLITSFARRPRPDPALTWWANAYTVFQAMAGTLWGATIYLFAHPDQPITVALTMCSLYSLGAGSVPSNAYNPKGLYAFVACTFVPMVVRLVATGTLEYVALATASGLYGVAMLGMCRVQARTLDEGFRIRFENRALLEQLTVQKAEAETARQQAERASLAKSQFLAAASHDLRQPLYALSLFSASLDQLKLDSDGRAVVGNIQDSIGAMEQLFDGLLDLSKLDAGVVQPRIGAVGIDELFDRLSQYFQPLAHGRGLDLRFRSDGEFVSSDPVLLEQVLGNLVANAIRYTAKGGVLIAARRRGENIRLEVWDTGIGIAAPDLSRIFEEFVQVGNAERDRRMGLGLGLSIARRSAALLGATIDVASRVGRGSRFIVTQPACAAPPVPIHGQAPARGEVRYEALDRRTDLPVLIVEDDRDVRVAFADLLTRWQIPFDAAPDGAAALSLIDRGARYGLVLSDYQLAGAMNGLDVIAAILARQEGPPPAAALVTANFAPGLVAAARAAGIPVIPKPLRAPQLRQLLGMHED